MKVVIPMAGRGTRLRPHTLTLPKPLLKLCGKTIIEWIVNEIKDSSTEEVDEIHFVIGDFGSEIEQMLLKTAEQIGSKGFIHYQTEALGTAHAIYCAKDALEGEVFIVFADTIFKGKIDIDKNVDGMIWTMLVDKPENYGVVKTNEAKIISDFVEKPKDFVSRNAIVGLYYFKEAEKLRSEIAHIIDNDLRENNEFQITNCLQTLTEKGDKLKCAELDEWLDCGNKAELLATNKRLVELTSNTLQHIEEEGPVTNSKLGSYVCIGKNVSISNSTLENCIIYDNSTISNCNLKDSIVGNNVTVSGINGQVYIGDYSELKND